MTPVLLDTDILSELLKLKNPIVVQNAFAYSQTVGPLAFAAVTRYEIRRGYKKKKAVRLLSRFLVYCQHATIFPVTDAIWERAEDLWVIGSLGGHPHTDADLLIAATALEHGRALATGNTSHFAWIPGLTVVDWRTP